MNAQRSELVLWAAQRVTALFLAAFVLVHLATIIYAVRAGLSASAILERTHDRVRGILTTKKAILVAAAQELKRTETLEGERLRRALAGDSTMEARR